MRKSFKKPLLVLIVSLLAALTIFGASAFQGSTPEASPAASPAG